MVTVDGVGSTWTATAASLSATVARGHSRSLAAVPLRRRVFRSTTCRFWPSMLVAVVCSTVKNGTGTISNNGTLRLLAAANIAAGDYTPISSGAWSGTGVYQAVGGILNTSTHVFTASNAVSEVSGAEVDLNLAVVQRAMVSDSGTDGTGWVVGASFLGRGGANGHCVYGDGHRRWDSDALTERAGEFQTVLGGWTFETSNYEVSASSAGSIFRLRSARSIRRTVWRYGTTTEALGRRMCRPI